MCLEEGVSAHATWAQSLRPEGHSKVLGLYHSITEQSHGGSCPAESGAVQQEAALVWALSSRVGSCPAGSVSTVGAVRPSSSHRRNAAWLGSLPGAESQGEKGSDCCLSTQLSHQSLPLARPGQKSAAQKARGAHLQGKGEDGSVGKWDMAGDTAVAAVSRMGRLVLGKL